MPYSFKKVMLLFWIIVAIATVLAGVILGSDAVLVMVLAAGGITFISLLYPQRRPDYGLKFYLLLYVGAVLVTTFFFWLFRVT